MIIITENTNIKSYIESSFVDTLSLYVGGILVSNEGFRNYIYTDFVEEITIPNEENFQMYFQIEDFQKVSGKKIKYIIPGKTSLKNCCNKYNNSVIIKSSISNTYNPIIAKTTIDQTQFSENLIIIPKIPRKYNDNNLYFLSCSNLSNYNSEFCVYNNIEEFSSELKNNLLLKTWKNLFPNIDFNSERIGILLGIEDGKYILLEKYIFDLSGKLQNIVESNFIYYKLNGNFNIDTTSKNIIDLGFSDTSETLDFEITQVEINNSIEQLTKENDVFGFLSFEFNGDLNSIPYNIFSPDKYFNFVSIYNYERYKNNPYDQIVEDFINNSDQYFNSQQNNTVVIANMYQKYDIYNDKIRYITLNGLYSGLIWKYGIIKILDNDINFPNLKLFYYPTIEERSILKSYNINSFYKRKERIYIDGNRNYHEKNILQYLNQNAISKILSYQLSSIYNTYKLLFNKKTFEKYLRVMVSDIEKILEKYSDELSLNSIQIYEDQNTNTNFIIEIIIYFKEYLEEFKVNINIDIK